MPIGPNHNATNGVPNVGPIGVSKRDEFITAYPERNFVISGVTKDSSGVALAACTVNLFNAVTNSVEQTAVSDAGGNYSFNVDKTKTWYVTAYKAGVPDVTGATVNTLVGT